MALFRHPSILNYIRSISWEHIPVPLRRYKIKQMWIKKNTLTTNKLAKTFFSSFLLYSSFLSLVILIDAFPVWLYNTGNSKKALTKKCKLCNFQTVILQLYKNWLNQGYFFKILIVQKFSNSCGKSHLKSQHLMWNIWDELLFKSKTTFAR